MTFFPKDSNNHRKSCLTSQPSPNISIFDKFVNESPLRLMHNNENNALKKYAANRKFSSFRLLKEELKNI